MKRMLKLSIILIFFVSLLTTYSAIYAQPKLPSPEGTDPVSLGLMQGIPVPLDKQVTANNFTKFPYSRWAFMHARELKPSRNIWQGTAIPSPLKNDLRDLAGLAFFDDKEASTTIDAWQKSTFTDAMIVLHKGKIVYEKYYPGMRPELQHLMFSVTKSFTGLLVTQLIYEGKIDPTALVSKYIPELAGSAWEDATVQQTLDMTTAISFTEVYSDPNADVWRYLFACNILPIPPTYKGPRELTEFLKTLKKNGKHGEAFVYRTVNSEVLGWLLRKVTGKRFADLMSERIWQPMGAEEDACVWVDPIGYELMGAGLNATLRDLARVGEMLRCRGMLNGRQIIDKEVVDEIRKGGDQKAYKKGDSFRPGYTYHNQWWITNNADGAFEALGVHGQTIHINPAAEMVIVKLSSHPVPSNKVTFAINTKAFQALANFLRE